MIEGTENETQIEDVPLIINSSLKVKIIRKCHISLPWYNLPSLLILLISDQDKHFQCGFSVFFHTSSACLWNQTAETLVASKSIRYIRC